MERWRQGGLARRFQPLWVGVSSLLHPPLLVLIAAPFAIAAMMIWVFLLGNENHPLSYVFFALSFYLLVVICAGVFGKGNMQRARSFTNKHKLSRRFLNDEEYRIRISIVVGIAVDTFWALINIGMGMAFVSAWFITLGCYYLLFGLMRELLLLQFNSGAKEKIQDACDKSSCKEGRAPTKKERKTAFACGVFMIASTFIMSGIATLLLHGDATIRYGEIQTIALAAFTFYSLIGAIIGLVRLRGRELLLVVNCRVNMCIALVSLFTLEMAMLATFGTNDDITLTLILPALTGAAVSVALCLMGILTVKQARTTKTVAQKDSDN